MCCAVHRTHLLFQKHGVLHQAFVEQELEVGKGEAEVHRQGTQPDQDEE